MAVVLTGFTSAIGKALLKEYINQGKTVFCLGRRDENILHNNKNLRKFFHLDFSSNSFNLDLDEIYNNLQQEKVDTIIHAAADSGKREQIRNQNYDDMKDLININYLNSAWFIKKSCDLLSLIDKRQNKSFIYISTQLAKYKGPGLSIYSSSKAAMNNLCGTLAHEYGFAGVRVNIVTPGIVSKKSNDNNIDISRLNIPLSRLAAPNDIVNAVLFLASSKSEYITGTNIDINGGR